MRNDHILRFFNVYGKKVIVNPGRDQDYIDAVLN